MENPNTNNRPGTTPEPARNGLAEAQAALSAYETGSLRDTMEAAADAFEAKLAQVEREVEALQLSRLARLMEQAAEQISEHASHCHGDESAWAYRAEAHAVYLGARNVRKLRDVRAALDAFTQEDCEWTSATVSDFVEQLRGIMEGGAK